MGTPRLHLGVGAPGSTPTCLHKEHEKQKEKEVVREVCGQAIKELKTPPTANRSVTRSEVWLRHHLLMGFPEEMEIR